jgi:hypothetical protein
MKAKPTVGRSGPFYPKYKYKKYTRDYVAGIIRCFRTKRDVYIVERNLFEKGVLFTFRYASDHMAFQRISMEYK